MSTELSIILAEKASLVEVLSKSQIIETSIITALLASVYVCEYMGVIEVRKKY